MRIHEPEQILTYEEVLEMIRHPRNVRDKAIVSFLYEPGARIGCKYCFIVSTYDFRRCAVARRKPLPTVTYSISFLRL